MGGLGIVGIVVVAAFGVGASLEPEPPIEREPQTDVAGAKMVQEAPPGVSVDAKSIVSRGFLLRYRPDQTAVKVSDAEGASVQLSLQDELGEGAHVALEAAFRLGKHEYRVRWDEQATSAAAGVGGSGPEEGVAGPPPRGFEAEIDSGGRVFGDERDVTAPLPEAPVLARARGKAMVLRDGALFSPGADVEVLVLERGIMQPGRERPVAAPLESAGPEVHLLVHGLPTSDVREGRAHLAFGSVKVSFERRVEAEAEDE